MKNKKRTLLLSLSCALAFVIALCGFNAYANSNVEAVASDAGSSVTQLVEQQQYQRNKNALKPVSSDSSTINLGKLYPAVYDDLTIDTITTDSTINNYCVWKNMNGAVDDIVCVKNVANNAIYVRTVFAFEAGNASSLSVLKEALLINKNDDNNSPWTWSEVDSLVKIGGQNYYILCATYNGSLAQGSISSPSLYQIALAKTVTKDFYHSLGDQYEVKVVSQAVVVDDSVGTDVAAVLNTVFGEIKVEDHPWKK